MRRQPKRTAYRKQMKGRFGGMDRRAGNESATGRLKFGSRGLMAREEARVTARQLEAGRRVRRYHVKRAGKVWIRLFPDVPVTAKPLEVRMGKGKGSVDHWVAKVRPGKRRFELAGVPDTRGRHALRCCGKKFPIKTTLVERALPVSLEKGRGVSLPSIERKGGKGEKE